MNSSLVDAAIMTLRIVKELACLFLGLGIRRMVFFIERLVID